MSKEIVEKDLSYKIVGILFDVQNKLGRFCREKQYADALEQELIRKRVDFEREKPIELSGQKSNIADFVIEGRVVVELKAKPFIQKQDYYQVKRYLKSSKKELGLLVNFQQKHLRPKRVLNTDAFNSEHLDVFVDSNRRQGQAALSLTFLIGGLVILMGSTLAFLVLTFLNASVGFQNVNRAQAVAQGGVHDAFMQLIRDNGFSDTTGYCVPAENLPCSAGSATVTVTQDSPSTDQATIVSEATVSRRTRKVQAVASINNTTGEVDLVSWELVEL